MAYVYKVQHTITGEFYIGSKYAKGATPENSEQYLGSVKGRGVRSNRYRYLLSNERHLLTKEVLSIHDSKENAIGTESLLHEAWFDHPLCLNGAKQTSVKFSCSSVNPVWLKDHPHPRGMKNKQHSETTKSTMREKRAKQVFTEETKQKISSNHHRKGKGRNQTIYTVLKETGEIVSATKRELRLTHNVRVERLSTEVYTQKGWRLI